MTDENIQTWLAYGAYHEGQHSVVGNVQVLADVDSPQLGNRRDLLVYLPPSHIRSERRYPVIYMQDGQNLFDRSTAFGGNEWQVDETLELLSQSGLEAIAVGLPHPGAERLSEYSPFDGFRPGHGDAYLDFVIDTVKPLIDDTFLTLPDREHTGLLGSSMGGLISLYGFFRRPEVFGLAASMSPALWYARGAIYSYVRQAPFNPGRVYLDHGSRENSATRMQRLLMEKGYHLGQELAYVEEEGGEHNEAAWARRLPGALRFLLEP